MRQVQIDLDQHALRSNGLSAQDVVNALTAQNLMLPAGTEKIGKFEYNVDLNDCPGASRASTPCRSSVNGSDRLRARRRLCARRLAPQTNMVRIDGEGVLMTILKTGNASTLDIIAGVKKLCR